MEKLIKLREQKVENEILTWYIHGCRIAQFPKMSAKNKETMLACIDTLKNMVLHCE